MWLERLEAEPLPAIPWLEHRHCEASWKHGSVNEDIGAQVARNRNRIEMPSFPTIF